MKRHALTRRVGSRRQREGGFALLLVFLMAAIIAVSLYMEIPRVAFETQRQKEQLLIERGEQYQIGLRRYYFQNLKNGQIQGTPAHWPSKMEDLEKSGNRRFIRKRYLDPMTGKDEWRLIHINGGMLTDSINNKIKAPSEEPSAPTGITEFASLNQAASGTGTQPVNAAMRRRASDTAAASGASTGDASNTGTDPTQTATAVTTTPPAGPTSPDGSNSSSGSSNSALAATGIAGTTSQTGTTSTTTTTPPWQLGQPVNSTIGGASPYSTVQTASGTAPTPNQPGSEANNSALQMINSLLTSPRPGGMPQVNPTGSTVTGSATMGGGIAGVASKVDADSIMVCGDHTNYGEWEFVFDPSKWRPPANPNLRTATGKTSTMNNTTAASSLSNSSMSNSTAASQLSGSFSIGGSTTGTSTGTSGSQSGTGQAGSSIRSGLGKFCGGEARPGAK